MLQYLYGPNYPLTGGRIDATKTKKNTKFNVLEDMKDPIMMITPTVKFNYSRRVKNSSI